MARANGFLALFFGNGRGSLLPRLVYRQPVSGVEVQGVINPLLIA
jgi:hypothetical protein